MPEMMRLCLAGTLSALALAGAPVMATAQDGAMGQGDTGRWVTLGTRAGPVASPERSQPANLLIADGRNILIDAGDGTAGQLIRAGVPTAAVDAVIISHLHFDHTGGLAAILGLRLQTGAVDPLPIYGPPGTAELIAGLLQSMEPGNAAGYGVPGAKPADLSAMTRVTELRDGDSFRLADMTVRVRNNTHYSFTPESGLADRFQSLSFRFDLPGRSIVYTGDTGPSTAVEELAGGADLLISEMMDVDDTIARIHRASPNMPAIAARQMESHLRSHHLTPADVGALAAKAGVDAVVITHFAGREPGDPGHFAYLRQIAATFDGAAVIANDMDEF